MNAKEKRKRVMSRSMKLGHCVCDPKKPCPCPLFKEKKICTCAGERVPPENAGAEVRLTDFVRSAGCASKISQKDLHKVLNQLPAMQDPRLIVGTATADDAGVFELTPDVTVVQTVDVFTPGVDDPYLFGRIAACNSLSDVYAMGGKPVTALSVIGFPIYSLPHEIMADIIRGGIDVLKEAGAILLGGHSINDPEIKFGFAVTGLINKSDLMTNAEAKPGDILVLTKPLGTGIISLANQIDKASQESIRAIEESMSSLNRISAEIMVRHKANACTDVTGFGLLGHLCQMVTESEVTAELYMDELPLFPGVLEYAEQGMFSGANERNAEYSIERTEFIDDISDERKAILYDAQTSGGLLIAISQEHADEMVKEMLEAGLEHTSVIGRITESSKGLIQIKEKNSSSKKASKNKTTNTEKKMSKKK
ncbi:selenide, water dikinase SelD, partial [Verrucomicrobiota bacterium]